MTSLYTSDPSVSPVRIAGLKHRRVPAIPLLAQPTTTRSPVVQVSSEPCYSDFIGGLATASTRRLLGERVAS